MAAVAEAEGIACNLKVGWREAPAKNARQVTSFNLIDPVADADLIINLCKLKTHCMTGLSGAVKKLFGCVSGLQKPEFHCRFKNPEEFCGMLIDLCVTVRPAHTIAVSGGKAHIDYANCIRCYCCHEMCPVKAIDIRRSGLFYH